jgi:hypothetical protein
MEERMWILLDFGAFFVFPNESDCELNQKPLGTTKSKNLPERAVKK